MHRHATTFGTARRAARGVATASLALCLAAGAARADDARARVFTWREANARLAAATEPDAFLRAAEAYAELIAQGVRNAPLYYNLGTALLLGGEPEAGLRALRRAERYGGTTWEIRRNMTCAVQAIEADPAATLPWYRVVLFWHYGPRTANRAVAAMGLYALVWLLLIRRLFGGRLGPVFYAACAALALIGSSVLASLHQEAADRAAEWRPAAAALWEEAGDAAE
jgi:hypothetical protein